MNTKTCTNPIFIGGLFKSGTSLLRVMLSQHSMISSGLETFWFDIDWSYEDGKDADSFSDEDVYEARRTQPLSHRLIDLFSYFDFPEDVYVPRIMAEKLQGEEIVSLLMDAVCQRDGTELWLEKTPGNLLHIQRIFSYWPQARFIHIHRDPLDVLSSYKQSGKLKTVDHFAKQWVHFMRKWQKSFAALSEQERKQVLVCSYEGLILETKSVVGHILEFLSLPYEDAVAAYQGSSKDYDRVKEVSGQESSTLKRLKDPINKSRLGIWKTVLTQQEVDRFRAIVKEHDMVKCLNEFSYESESGVLMV